MSIERTQKAKDTENKRLEKYYNSRHFGDYSEPTGVKAGSYNMNIYMPCTQDTDNFLCTKCGVILYTEIIIPPGRVLTRVESKEDNYHHPEMV